MSELCPDCNEAKQHMKAQGFRNWRNHACYDHAGVDLNGEWFLSLLAERGVAATPEQPDLFGVVA